MLKAVIFDFDGVIADSEMMHLSAFNQALMPHNCRITKQDYFDKYLGLTDIECFRMLAKQGQLELDEKGISQIADNKKHFFEKMLQEPAVIIQGVIPFLDMLQSNKIPLAIYSGALKSEVCHILQNADLLDRFSVVVAADDVEKPKPHPEGFLLAIQKLNDDTAGKIAPQHCVVIEDSHWGIDAAIAAGMNTIAVTNSYAPQQLSNAQIIVDRLDQITIELLNKLCV